MRILVPIVAACLALLAACGPQPAPDGKAAGGVPGKPEDPGKPGKPGKGGPKTRYDLANGCFVLKPWAGANYVAASGRGYAAAAKTADAAERFYLKPTALGSYLFYARDARMMATSRDPVAVLTQPDAVVTTRDPSVVADWTVDTTGKGVFTVRSIAAGRFLTVGEGGALALGDQAATFAFERARDCAEFPEMPTGIAADTYTGPAVGQPVIGFAEVHAHMAMGSELSDGSGNVGPSAGGVMYGQAMNRYGVSKALEDCSGMHGPDGELSPEWAVLDGGNGDPPQHDTQGWPTFIFWPRNDSQLHQQMYWRWVERAWKAGLRIMTVHGTNIEALCEVAKHTGNDKDADLADTDCDDMGIGVKQVQYLYDIEKYVDAQEGGPGKGWFRIVRDPLEARAVIAEGRLAVIPGLEFSNMFGCNLSWNADGSETSACTREQIDQEIERVWNEGVRQIFAYHDVDSALGGAGIFNTALNLVNFYGTGQFWKTYDCPAGEYYYGGGAVMESSQLTRHNDPISRFILDSGLAAGRLPFYGPGRQCNARGMTELGRYALDRMMQRGFVLDIDHAELSIKQDMLDLGKALAPNYPMISAHGGHGGISMAQARQILEQGGLIYPSVKNGEGYRSHLQKVKAIWPAGRPLAMGYGADANGLADLPGPRGSAASRPVSYPFTLFRGEGWGPQFAAAGIAPLQVELLEIPESGKYWNPDEVGFANYGAIADMVEQIRIEGGEEAVTALYNSAEAYLQMWEQTLAASASARAR